jgi:[NiFe] hydrogenase small subunit
MKKIVPISGDITMDKDQKPEDLIAQDEAIEKSLIAKGLSRRDFMKFCGLMAITLGLESTFIPKIARAIATAPRPPIVWLQFAECTGCTEAFLRTSDPFIGDLILDKFSLEYHETLMAAAGDVAHACLNNAISAHSGKFFCFVEGAIPTADNGIYGMIGGKTMLRIAEEVLPHAKKVISVGTCAAHGGLPAAVGGLTGAKGVKDAVGISTINMPGCPPNPVNLAALIVGYLLEGSFPAVDSSGRPTFAYGSTVHSQCPRRGTELCLMPVGCRGSVAAHNCPSALYNDKTSWCVRADANCTAADFFDRGSFFNYDADSVADLTPPEITIDTPADNSMTDKTSITVSGMVDEPVQSVTVAINDGSPLLATLDGAAFSVVVGLVGNASNTIRITATDLAGNESSVTRTVTADPAAPALAITEPGQDTRTTRNSITVSGTATSNFGPVSVVMTAGGETFYPTLSGGNFIQEIAIADETTLPVKVTATDLFGNRSEVTRLIIRSTPDLNNDGTVDIADALKALRVSVGLEPQPTGGLLFRGDVAPMLNGMPAPDGRIDVGDALVILRKVVGLANW